MQQSGVKQHESAILSAPHAVAHIAVFRALQLGDMLCAVPALRALRAGCAGARITLIGLPWAHEFTWRFRHYVDGFIAFPGAPGLPERAASESETREFMRRARAAHFDLALQLHGDGRYSNGVVASLGARDCAGFYPARDACPDPARFIRYPDDEPETRRLLRLVEFLGAPSRGEALEFPMEPGEWRALARLRADSGLRPGQYACVHPGARAPARRWPPERFARVADELAGRGLQVVLTGSAQEAAVTAEVAQAMLAPSVNLAGRTSIGTMAALLAGAKLLVCNDTGVSHLAAALSTPSVVVFTASSPARWAPRDRRRHRVVYRDVDCRPCEHRVCPIGHPCATGVAVSDVLRAVDPLLMNRHADGNYSRACGAICVAVRNL